MNAEHTENTSKYIFAQSFVFFFFFTEDSSQSLLILRVFLLFCLCLQLLLSFQLHLLELLEGVASDWH